MGVFGGLLRRFSMKTVAIAATKMMNARIPRTLWMRIFFDQSLSSAENNFICSLTKVMANHGESPTSSSLFALENDQIRAI